MKYFQTTLYVFPNTDEGKEFAQELEFKYAVEGIMVNKMVDNGNIYIGFSASRDREKEEG